jgi:hypothetical protein
MRTPDGEGLAGLPAGVMTGPRGGGAACCAVIAGRAATCGCTGAMVGSARGATAGGGRATTGIAGCG